MGVYFVKVIPHSTEPPDDLPDARIRRARVHERKLKSGKEKGEVIQHCWESFASGVESGEQWPPRWPVGT